MPSLEDIYGARGTRQSDSGLYTITNTPWIAQYTQEKAITFSREDYSNLVTVTIGPPSKPIQLTWPLKIFCLNSLFFRSIFLPPIPVTPDTTPTYIRVLRDRFHQTSNIPFPCTSTAHIEAFSIFASWNTQGEIKHAKQFSGITSEDVHQRLNQYSILWNQLLECYRLSQLLIAPKFANKIIDTMIEAIGEECSWQTRRRKLEDEDEQFAIDSLGSEEYQALAKRLDEVSLVTGDDVFNQTQSRAETLNQRPSTSLQPPDSRHVLGATPLQITKLYADTNPGAPLRRMIVDMIISYSIRFPKYYGQNGGFGELLGGSDPGTADQFCVPMEFVRDLLTAYAKANGVKNDRRMDENGCKYHDHKYGGTAACSRARARANDNATSIAEAAVNALEDTGKPDVVTENF
ncbi:1742a407-b0ef-408f-85d0-2b71c0f1e42f [Sclerotinia trifoliorum]|uniref:1742a407-b0ef-408f-85d0-2b71c0f1e42f n=1 Tax=Sclerotinia trifoliorum TaxID=28548 RepID=A0A8H2ZMF6_9HELO|nr:1742a407-b0ef-408f-85d0-2b71c0f1e42f [Sclerotinia trifoliorum]